jgi:two-component system response regulator
MNNKWVLLVEDNDDDIELTLRAFKKHNLVDHFTIARDGQEAIDILMAQGTHATRNAKDVPALILLDLKMPKMSGLEVLQTIRSQPLTRCIPVVVLTTSDQPEDKLESYRSGANSYIRKPVDFNQFMEMALHLGIYWLSINEPPPANL